MKYLLVCAFITFSAVEAIQIKDLSPCKKLSHVPPVTSVVIVNCTQEPCFFGKDNGLPFQFIITPEKTAHTVSVKMEAETLKDKTYEIEVNQRTSCAHSYCQLEPKVPRCFSAIVRRKKQPRNSLYEPYRFTVKFTDQNGKVLACSRFVLATMIKYGKSTKPVYKPSYSTYGYTSYTYEPTVGKPYDSYDYKPAYERGNGTETEWGLLGNETDVDADREQPELMILEEIPHDLEPETDAEPERGSLDDDEFAFKKVQGSSSQSTTSGLAKPVEATK